MQARKFFDLPHDEKMKAVHPPKANPNRGYSYVGQENVALISKLGKNPGLTRDIKVRRYTMRVSYAIVVW